MALPFSNTVDRTIERLRTAFVETARGAREVVGAPLRPDLPDDDIVRLRGRIDACLEGKGGETARRGRAAELGQAYLSLSAAGRKRFLLTLANDYGLSRDAAQALGRNPIAIIVPCHRVLGADGRMGGFSAPGGASTKRRMLEIEGASALSAGPLFS